MIARPLKLVFSAKARDPFLVTVLSPEPGLPVLSFMSWSVQKLLTDPLMLLNSFSALYFFVARRMSPFSSKSFSVCRFSECDSRLLSDYVRFLHDCGLFKALSDLGEPTCMANFFANEAFCLVICSRSLMRFWIFSSLLLP